MKTTRRNFLKGLLAVGTAALVPQALVEKVHGASDLTPQERDIAADVMGLRRETWAGADLWHPKTMRRTSWADGMVMTDKIDDWEIEHGDLVMFQDAKTELFIDGEWRLAVDALNRMGQAAQSASHSFDALEHVWPSPEWEREFWEGKPGGQMPVGILSLEPGTTIVGVDSAARPSFSFPERELYLNDVRQAFVRGSRLIADNIGVTLPPLRAEETDQDVGRALVQVFDNYASENDVDPCAADSIREDIRDAWGLNEASKLGFPTEITIRGAWMKPSGDMLNSFADVDAAAERISTQAIDNIGLIIDVGYVSYMAALSKGKLVDSLTESEKRQAFMNELLRGDGTDVISDTTPTWGGEHT